MPETRLEFQPQRVDALQPTMALDPEGASQGEAGQGQACNVPALLDRSTLVASFPELVTGTTHHPQGALVLELVGAPSPSSQVADLLHQCERLLTADKSGSLSLPGPEAMLLFGLAESAPDIPSQAGLAEQFVGALPSFGELSVPPSTTS